jgi:hypothetical protein
LGIAEKKCNELICEFNQAVAATGACGYEVGDDISKYLQK